MKRSILSATILGILGVSSSFTVLAANQQVTLCAGQFDKELSGPADTVPMWGYSLGTASDPSGCAGPFSSPGPRIKVEGVGVTGLDVTLNNTLPRATSLVIPGTIKGMAPAMFHFNGNTRFPADPAGVMRVRSFDAEAPAYDGTSPGTMTYSWDNLKPGSYMYHSGTHAQVQVQMGLYGAATHDFATNEAYEGKPYSQEIILFYSEIDRVIHNAVAVDGSHNETDMLSTVDYDPKYHFISVENSNANPLSTYDSSSVGLNNAQVVKMTQGTNPLIRFYNAGLKTHVPTVFEADFDVFAEDGKLSPHVKKQYSVTLPPLKTKDAILNIFGGLAISSSGGSTFKLTDSAMAISNPQVTNSGEIVLLDDGNEIANGDDNGMVLNFVLEPAEGYTPPVASNNHPKAVRDNMTVVEGGSIADIMGAAQVNDVNATDAKLTILTYPVHGELTNNGNGHFNYQHNGGEEDRDSLVYSLTNSSGESSIAGISIDVIAVNDEPVAQDDTVTAKVGQTIEIRALNNDSDVDSSNISIQSVGVSSLGSLTAMSQVIVFEPTTVGTETVSYVINDGHNATATAQLHLTVTEATGGSDVYTAGDGPGPDTTTPTGVAPEAVDKQYTVMEGAVLDITGNAILGVLGSSLGAKASTGLLEYPEHGAIQMFEDGTFVYTHNGDEEEDDHFEFEIYNDHGTSSAKVTIVITPKMNPPRVNNDRAKTKVDTAVVIDIFRNDRDKDSALNPNGIMITEMPEHGVLDILTGGNVRYTPNAGFKGKDKFKYRLADVVTGELSKRAAKVKIRVR